MWTVVSGRCAARGSAAAWVVGFAFSIASWSAPAHAQSRAAVPPAPPGSPAAQPGGVQPVAPPAPAAPSASAPAGASAAAAADAIDTSPMPVPSELLNVQPGGITAAQVGDLAAKTSWNAKAYEQAVRSAAARVDEAWAAFLPRLSGVAKYTRLSNFSPPSLGGVLVTTLPNGATLAADNLGQNFAEQLVFPLVLNNFLLQGTITVPISDYFFRIDQTYTAATRSQDAARWDVVTARAAAAANGRAAYYTWLRARGAVVVAVQALNDQKTHLRDARNQFTVGNASKADVLRAETGVSSAELALERAKNLSDLTEKQLRVAVHAPDERAVVPGEDLTATLAPLQGNVKQFTLEAMTARPEIKSADANAASARETITATKANAYPVLSAFADGIVANPNPRIFPQTATTFPSWDLGAQLTWSPNDALTTSGATTEAETRVAQIEANKNNVRDGIDVEVTQTWQAVKEADFAVDASLRELASAEEAYRVARELFNNGRGTSTTLTDAETDLTRARLDQLNARADARIARVRFEHALGRDARPDAP